MRIPERRLARLEARIQGVWPADVAAAKVRELARVRLTISVALGAVGDPASRADDALLAADTPERAAADLEILRRWGRHHPATLYPDDGARARIAARLEEMARRMRAQP